MDTKDPKDSVIRLKIDKPSYWDWQLTTSSDTIQSIQLLAKDGRLLVETVGGTAQRAKGSFREGLKSYEEFPESLKNFKTKLIGNRNFEGYSSKFESSQFGKPRKSRSDVDVRNGGRKSRKRNSSIEITSRSEGSNKKYSPGDYLRQQILDDLRTNSTVGKTPNEIAQVRCEKVRVYLRNKSDSSFNRESRGRTRNDPRRRVDRSVSNNRRRSLQNDGSLSFDRAYVSGRRDSSGIRKNGFDCGRDASNDSSEDYNNRRDVSNSRSNIYNNRRDISNSRNDNSNNRRDASNSRRDVSNSRRDASNSRRDASNIRRDVSNDRNGGSNSRRDVSNDRSGDSNIRRDSKRDVSNSRRDISNNRRDTSNSRRDVSNTRTDAPNNKKDASADKHNSNSRKDSCSGGSGITNTNGVWDSPTEINETTRNATDISKSEQISPDTKVPFPQKTVNSFKTGKQLTKQEFEKIRGFLQDRISAKMNEEKLLRSRSQPIGTNVYSEIEMESEKRYSDCSFNQKNYPIRKVGSDASVVRFSERQLQPSESRHNLEDSSDLRRKLRSRTRVDALLEADELENIHRERKPVMKHKLYSRKTRSDTLLGNLDSKHHLMDNLERTWKEYKDRKKVDSKLDKLDTSDMEEEDFMKKPRWKDLQFKNCSVRNCRICENLKNCVNPLASEHQEESDNCQLLKHYQGCKCQLNEKEQLLDINQNGKSSPDINTRPKTALQENYLVLERATSPQHDSIISETTTNSREEEISTSSWNSPDFGYNSIPKQSRDYKEILCSNSAVKKSDTFKVVDGSEDVMAIKKMQELLTENGISETSIDICDELSENTVKRENSGKQSLNRQSNEEIAEDYFIRVYELLKKRKEEVRQLAQVCNGSERELEETETLKPRRRRRRKIIDSLQGEKYKTSEISFCTVY